MKFKILTGLILSSAVATADTIFLGEHSIAFDTVLDGAVYQPNQNSFTFSGTSEHFIASSNNQILSGNTARSDLLINFNLSDNDGSSLSFYAGKLDADGNYKGTWYDNLGGAGDWIINSLINDDFQNCKQILDAGRSLGDGIYPITTEDGVSITVYCDMTTDDGGWTLVGTYPKTAAGGISRISQYPFVPETSPNNPSNLWLYKWNLAHFADVREQVSCSAANCTDGKSVYGASFSELELNNVRFSWGYDDRVENSPKVIDFPSCRKSYTDTSVWSGCINPSSIANNSTKTVVGWQTDLFGATHCWAARGNHASSSLGSSRCATGNAAGDPNGTQWALLWMR